MTAPMGGAIRRGACQQNALQLRLLRVVEATPARNSPGFDAYCVAILPRIVGVAQSITGNRQDAEDAAIEALARAFLHWHRLQRSSWRDAWVIKVTSRLAIDQLRALRRIPSGQVEIHDPHPEQDVEDRELLMPALRDLPRRQQQAIVLYYFGGLSYQEIARVQKVSMGSVKTHLHRAMKTLRVKFNVSLFEEEIDAQRRTAL